MMGNKELGVVGEKIATDFLENEGYEIIDRNVHFSRACEIDIIAKKKDTLVFVEVKTRRTNDFGTPIEAITKKKYENIKIGVFNYINSTNVKFKKYQIDAIGITMNPDLKVEHYKNI